MMKKKTLTMLAALLMLGAGNVSAQVFNHLGVGVSAGLDGIGFDLSAPITDYVAVRAGMSIWPKITYKTDVTYEKRKNGQPDGEGEVKVEGKLNKSDVKVLFDFYPGKNTPFHLTAGAFIGKDKVITARNLTPIAEANGGEAGIIIGDYFVSTDKDGYADASIKVKGFKPYLGIGFGRAVPKKRFGVNFDMGVQFWGSPGVYTKSQTGIDASGNPIYEDVKATSADFDGQDGGAIETISKISVFPVLSLRICGRIL